MNYTYFNKNSSKITLMEFKNEDERTKNPIQNPFLLLISSQYVVFFHEVN